MAERGCEVVIGVDEATAMLAKARRKPISTGHVQ
jgi:hypothetical protein